MSKRQHFRARVQHQPQVKSLGHSALQMFEPAEVAGHDGLGGFHFNADNAPIGRFENSVDFNAIARTKVVKRDAFIRPTRLPGELAQDEVFEQRPHRGVVFHQSLGGSALEIGTEPSVDEKELVHFHGAFCRRGAPRGNSLQKKYFFEERDGVGAVDGLSGRPQSALVFKDGIDKAVARVHQSLECRICQASSAGFATRSVTLRREAECGAGAQVTGRGEGLPCTQAGGVPLAQVRLRPGHLLKPPSGSSPTTQPRRSRPENHAPRPSTAFIPPFTTRRAPPSALKTRFDFPTGPLGTMLSFPFRVPGLKQFANAVYDKVAFNRVHVSAWVGLSACGVPTASQGPALPKADTSGPMARGAEKLGYWASTAAVGLLMVTLCGEIVNANFSVPQWLRYRQPEFMQQIVEYPRLLQGWRMFAPVAPVEDFMIQVDAVTVDGRRVAPYNEVASSNLNLKSGEPLGDVIPANMGQGQYFTGYSLSAPNGNYVPYRPPFEEWILATRNARAILGTESPHSKSTSSWIPVLRPGKLSRPMCASDCSCAGPIGFNDCGHTRRGTP